MVEIFHCLIFPPCLTASQPLCLPACIHEYLITQTFLLYFFPPAFLFAIFPKSFKTKYRVAVRNFKRNSRRLTTHYDIYETLKDLTRLDEDSLANEKIRKRTEELAERGGTTLPRGMSLFLDIPEQRTCDSAGIER